MKTDKTGYVEVTDEIIAEISFHKTRTGVGPQKLLKGQRKIAPTGLSSALIYNWLNKSAGTAKKEYVDFVKREYKALPNTAVIAERNLTYKEGLEAISSKNLERLKLIKAQTGLLPSKLFELKDDTPKFLNTVIVSNWINKKDYKARPEELQWVLESCSEILEEVLKELKSN